MANNPFYPGYVSDKPIDGSASPFYPGYYAGKPISRRPQSKNFLKPLGEYNVDEFFGEVDRIGTTAVTGVPTYIKDRLVDDFQQSLKATYRPPDINIADLDDYDPDVLPGVASVSLSLNPKDWVNPKEQLEKTAKSWIKSTTGLQFAKKGWGITGWDSEDYQNRINAQMWNLVTGIHGADIYDSSGNAQDPNDVDLSTATNVNEQLKKRFSTLQVEGKKAIEGRTLAGLGYEAPNASAPLSFAPIFIRKEGVDQNGNTTEVHELSQNYAGLQNAKTGANMAREVGRNISDFEQNSRSGLKRDSSYDKFLLASLQMSNRELNTVRRDQILQRVRDSGGEEAENNAKKALEILRLRSDVATEVTDLGAGLTGFVGVATKLQKRISGSIDAADLGLVQDTYQQAQGVFVDNQGFSYDVGLGKSLISLRERNERLLSGANSDGSFQKGSIASFLDQIHNGVALDPNDPDNRTKLMEGPMAQATTRQLEQMRAYTENLQRQLLGTLDFSQIKSKESEVSRILGLSEADAKAFIKRADDKKLTQADLKLLNSKGFNKNEAAGKRADELLFDQIEYENGKTIALQLSGRRISGTGYDARVTAVKAGRVDERAFNRSLRAVRDAKGRPLSGGTMFEGSVERSLLHQFEYDLLFPGAVKGIDPNAQVGSLLRHTELQDLNLYSTKARIVAGRLNIERVSYQMDEFTKSMQDGKIIENYVWKPLITRFTGYTPAELTTELLKKQHYFGLLIDDNYVTTKQMNSKVFNALFQNKINVSIGGSKFRVNGGKHFEALVDLNANSANFFDGALTEEQILALLMGESNLTKGAGLKYKMFGFFNGPGRRDLQLKIDRFRAWLESRPDIKAGLMGSDGKLDKSKLLEFYKGLIKENKDVTSLKITKKYVGLMDRIGPALNKVQNRIFNSWLFQRFVKPVLQLKTIIQERIVQVISAALAKLLNGAITAATGGVGIVLTPILEKIIKPIIGFLVRKTTAYVQNFMSGLLHGDWQAMMKQMEKEVSNTVRWALIITGFPVVVMMLVILGIMGAFSTTVSPIDPTKNAAGYGAANQSGGIIPPNENAYMKVTKDVEVTTSSGTSTNPGPPIPNEELAKAGGVRAHYIITVTAKQAVPAGISWYDFTTQSQQSVGGKALYQTGPNALPAMTQGQSMTLSIDDQSFGPGDEDSIISNTIMLDFSQAAGLEDVDSISFTRQFGIGNVVSEVPNCEGLPAGVLPPQVSSPGPGGQIAARAYQIASGLQRGFWCNFNHSMEYPELWNQGRFEADPFPAYPGDIQNEPNSLFWCTWMTAKTYTSVWGKIPNNQLDPLSTTDNGFPDAAGSWFQITTIKQNVNYLWMPRASTPISQIQPGDIIFYNKGGALAHVGIVYSKTSQSITTIESNNFVLSVTIPTESCGSGDCPVAPVVPTDTDMEIYGFGRHK